MITPERIEEINQELRETAAADSLKRATKTKPTTDAEVDALSVAMKLNTDQKQRHIDYLQKSLSADGNDAWKKADGDAKRGRRSQPTGENGQPDPPHSPVGQPHPRGEEASA